MKLKVGILIIAVLVFSLNFFRTKQEDTSKPTQKEVTPQLSQKKAPHPPAKETPLPEKPKRVETETESSVSDIILAKTIKMILRQVVNHVDIEAKRQYAIEKIKRKSDRKYLKEMNKIFDDLEYMNITDTFGLGRNSSRKQVITVIKQIDKDTLLERLDELPDQAIARLIKKKLREQEIKSIADIKDFLKEKIDKVLKPKSERKEKT